MSDIKAVVFDMDGVLIDSESLCDIIWGKVAQEMQLENILSCITACRGLNRKDSVEILRQFYGPDFDGYAFLDRCSELFMEVEASDGVPLMPYVKETLEYLSKKYILCVASSTRKIHVLRELEEVGVAKYFKTFTTGDEVEHGKPDPEIYIKACKSIGCSPDQCVGIEDSFNGVRSSVAAGLKTIMIPDRVPANDEMKSIAWKICTSMKDVQCIL